MKPAFVIDNSVVTGWWNPRQADDYTRAVRRLCGAARMHAPGLWVLEFANVLRKAVSTRQLDRAEAQEIIRLVGSAAIEVEKESATPAGLLDLALAYGLTAYDAAYLALAQRRKLRLAVRDGALARAAEASGVGVFLP